MAMMTLEARSNDVRSLKGDAGWRRESSWSSRHGHASCRFLILNPAMHQGQAVASGRPRPFHFYKGDPSAVKGQGDTSKLWVDFLRCVKTREQPLWNVARPCGCR